MQEKETENLPQTPEVKPKTLSKSETHSTSHLDKLPDPLTGLEDLMDLEALEGQEDQENQ